MLDRSDILFCICLLCWKICVFFEKGGILSRYKNISILLAVWTISTFVNIFL